MTATCSAWQQAVRRNDVLRTTNQYVARVRTRVQVADDALVAEHAREDLSRLVRALAEVTVLHCPDGAGRCRGCARRLWRAGAWPCVTLRAVHEGLEQGWPL